MADKLLLTDRVIQGILDEWRPFTTTPLPMIREILKAQLAKSKPIIEKQERERIIKLSESEFENDFDKGFVWVSFRKKDWQALRKVPK